MITDYDQNGYPSADQRGYQPYDQQRATILERGRAIRLMRNGDSFFAGRSFVINQKKYPMLDVFLDDASKALSANFGAVRCIYTPKHGRRLKDISDFEDHRTYVAAGGEKFKKLHYLDIAEGKRTRPRANVSPKLQLPPVPRIDAEGRVMKLSRSENVIIYVYRNGDPLTLPTRILLAKPTLQRWESVLDEITKKVVLSNTAVLKLYAMNGELITSAQQLEYHGMYIAGGKERFKRLDYPDPKSLSSNSSPKTSRKSSNLPSSKYTKSGETNTYTATTTSYGSLENSPPRRPVREENDFFTQKPQQHRRGPTKETDFDRDDGGVYKSRSTHREHAREIDETLDTKIDLPIDYRQAQTVEDEHFYGNIGKTPRRHQPQPADPRLRPMKSPMKISHDDDNQYPYTNNRTNGYDNDYHRRTPAQQDDDRRQQPSPYSSSRKPFISPNPQAHHDPLHEDKQLNHQQQPLQVTERRNYDDDYM